MKLLITQFSPACCHLSFQQTKYFLLSGQSITIDYPFRNGCVSVQTKHLNGEPLTSVGCSTTLCQLSHVCTTWNDYDPPKERRHAKGLRYTTKGQRRMVVTSAEIRKGNLVFVSHVTCAAGLPAFRATQTRQCSTSTPSYGLSLRCSCTGWSMRRTDGCELRAAHGSSVTVPWRVFKLRLKSAARYEQQTSRIWIRSRGQPTRGDILPLGWG
jgi:hypothetical protein